MRTLLLSIPTIRRKSLIEWLQVSEEPAFYIEQIFCQTWQEPSKSHRLFTCVSESSVLRRMGNVFPIFPTLLSSSLTTLVATLRLLCAPRTPIHYTILCSWALKLSVFKGQVAVEIVTIHAMSSKLRIFTLRPHQKHLHAVVCLNFLAEFTF